MGNFDANTDCITGVEISVEDVLKAALREPFDDVYVVGNEATWDLHAALAVLKDLSWRNEIGPVLKSCDKKTRVALTLRVRDIIAAAGCRNQNLVDLRARLSRAKDRAFEYESEVSRLSLELQDERSKRITAQQDLEDALGGGFISESASQTRLTVAKAVLLELEADEKRGRISALEDQLSEAVAKADIADYTRECIAARCKELEALMPPARGHIHPLQEMDVFKKAVTNSDTTRERVAAFVGEAIDAVSVDDRKRWEKLYFNPRVVGADIQTTGGQTTVTVSETIEPDGTVDGPTNTVMVTTTGTDVTDVLERHQSLVAFHCQDTSDREWQGAFVFVGDECFAIRVPSKDGDRFLEAMRKFTAAESEAA